MHGTNLQNKKSVYNYRLKNPDKIKKISKRHYDFKRISIIFRMILIDELSD